MSERGKNWACIVCIENEDQESIRETTKEGSDATERLELVKVTGFGNWRSLVTVRKCMMEKN